MEMNQTEFGIVKALLEKPPVCFLPDTFLGCPVFDKFHISYQGHAVPAEEIANAGPGIGFKMGCFSIDSRALGGYKINIRKASALAMDSTQVRG